MSWQSPLGTPQSAPKFWASVQQMIGNSNFSNPNVPTRPMPVGMPPAWQPPVTTNTTADSALKGLPS